VKRRVSELLRAWRPSAVNFEEVPHGNPPTGDIGKFLTGLDFIRLNLF